MLSPVENLRIFWGKLETSDIFLDYPYSLFGVIFFEEPIVTKRMDATSVFSALQFS